MRIKLTFILLSLCIIGCKKPSDRNCWKGSGDPQIDIIKLETFNSISIGPKLQVTLVQDTTNYLEIIGFKNLNSKIRIEINEQVLLLDNENKCDFLRSYNTKALGIRLHFIDINKIEFNGTAPLITEGQISTNSIELSIVDGASTVNLNINTHSFMANQGAGFSDFNINGNCDHAKVSIANNGYCDLLGLNIRESLSFINRSQADGKININGTTNVKLQTISAGNIFFKGTPINLSTSEISTGKIYRIN